VWNGKKSTMETTGTRGYLKKGKGEGGLVVVGVVVWRIGTGRSRDSLGRFGLDI
jgi:hypothetical protein